LAQPGRPLLLDTDVVSLLMRKHLDPTASGLIAYEWCVSFITVGELAKGAAMPDGTFGAGTSCPSGCATS
jgi:predicted nucleic acid-binding protein